MVVYHIEHPTAIYNPGIYNGTNLELKYMPNLSDHPEIHSCYFNTNDICSIGSDLFPPNVKDVSFYNNCLREDGLPVRWPNTIKILQLDRNQIKTTNPVAEWPIDLETLSLDDNPLVEVPQRLPSNLNLLSMSYCRLTSISKLPENLKRIRAYYNRIHKVDPFPASVDYIHLALVFLNLDHNAITSLPSSLPETLETLSLVGNKLTELPAQLPAALKLLILNGNRIRHFKPEWKPDQRLFQLHIRDNCLTENILPLKEQGLVDDIFQANNWNQEMHHIHATIVQRAFKRYSLRKAIRIWARYSRVCDELIAVSYSPELVIKYHDIDTLRLQKW
jgi:Leucine-rich repeat (LRR) protein